MQTVIMLMLMTTMILVLSSPLVTAMLPADAARTLTNDQKAAESQVEAAARIVESTAARLRANPASSSVPLQIIWVNSFHLPCFASRCYLNWSYRDLANPFFPVSRFSYCNCIPGWPERLGYKCCCCCSICGCRDGSNNRPCIKYCYNRRLPNAAGAKAAGAKAAASAAAA